VKRVGIVGAGLMGNWHAERWQRLPVEIAGFYNHSPQAARAAADRWGGQAYDSLDALAGDVDIVDVCTPTFAHKEGVLAAARHGKPVACEKPLARTLADAYEMIAACERAGVPLFVAHVVRFFPQYALAKQALEAGEVGRPGVLRLLRAGVFPRADPATWYNSFEKGGGVIMDLSIHDLDFARWCFGEVNRVFARGLTFSGKSMCDHAQITLRFGSGALAHVEGSWASPPGPFRTALELAGDKGLLEWDAADPAPLHASVRAAADAAEKVPQSADSPLHPEDDPYYLELRHFLDTLEHGGSFRVTPQDGLEALRLALAATESVRTGRPVVPKDIGGEAGGAA
jgi:predicted dehydrogenase